MVSSPPQDLTGESFAIGGLADIWMGEWSRESSTQIVAVKVIRDVRCNTEYFERLKKKLLLEAQVWSQLDHPNITPFYGISFDLGPQSTPCLICPYFKNGNVAKYLETNPGADRMKLVSQVATGLAYLHHCKIIHGDMKASNILVNDEYEACITDFGLSRVLGESGFTTKSICGTCRWMACELITPSNEEEEETIPQITTATDVWAFGMTVLEILSGRVPFFCFNNHFTVVHFVTKGGRPTRERYPGIGDDVWSLMDRCWHADPAQRPSMEFLARDLGYLSKD